MRRWSNTASTAGRLCLTHQVAFCDGVTTSVDKGRATSVHIHLDMCKAFDMVPHNILTSKVERYMFEGWTIRWMKNWLEGHSQRIVVSGSMSRWRPVSSGIPQGVCLGTSTLQHLYQWHRQWDQFFPSRFADHSKMGGTADTIKGRDAIQGDLG